MNTRMNRKRLNIGTYILQPYARTEAHVRELAAAGIDFVVCMENDRAALDLFEKYGVGAIVTGVLPGWWGGDGENAGRLREINPLSAYAEAARKFQDHPAIWGIDVGDEPSALDFPYYGEVFDKVSRLFPAQFPYLNLYPNYASVAKNTDSETVNQLGTPTYQEHIDAYCRSVPADYLCYDFYVYSSSVPGAYDNLRITADACRNSGRSLWIVLQVNSHVPDKWITENQLRFQAFSAMAFGVENITWACYTAGWWNNQVVDEKGEKTVQYERLRKINGEIRNLADRYMEYRRTATHFVGFENTGWTKGTGIVPTPALSTGFVRDLQISDGGCLIAGEMVSRTDPGEHALMLCTADDPYDCATQEFTVSFRIPGEAHNVQAFGNFGKVPLTRNADGSLSFTAASNQGILITVC